MGFARIDGLAKFYRDPDPVALAVHNALETILLESERKLLVETQHSPVRLPVRKIQFRDADPRLAMIGYLEGVHPDTVREVDREAGYHWGGSFGDSELNYRYLLHCPLKNLKQLVRTLMKLEQHLSCHCYNCAYRFHIGDPERIPEV